LHGHVRSAAVGALRVSRLSVVWTLVASAAAVTLGVRNNSAVLVAFGAVGVVDAVGSVALAMHFAHALRENELSERSEALVHQIVLVGMLVVGAAAVAVGAVRLLRGDEGGASVAGIVLAALSLVALSALSTKKLSVARRVASAALRSDAHLSAIGAAQAAVTLVGAAVTELAGWAWTDAAATSVLGASAVGLSLTTRRIESRSHAGADGTPSTSAPVADQSN